MKTFLKLSFRAQRGILPRVSSGLRLIWITAGRESAYRLIERMREVGKALKDGLAAYDTDLGCINRYRTAHAIESRKRDAGSRAVGN